MAKRHACCLGITDLDEAELEWIFRHIERFDKRCRGRARKRYGDHARIVNRVVRALLRPDRIGRCYQYQ